MSNGLDTSRFQKALLELIPRVQHTVARTLNKHLFYIARGASRLTPVSTKVESDMGVLAYASVRSRKTGKTRRGKVAVFAIGTGNRIAAIINARRMKGGKPPLKRIEMGDAIKKLIAARLRSKGTERSGWIAAIRILGASIGESSYAEERVSVTHTSIATTAKDGWSPVAELEYKIISTDTHNRHYIDAKTQDALQTAFNYETSSIEKFLGTDLQKDFDKVNTK